MEKLTTILCNLLENSDISFNVTSTYINILQDVVSTIPTAVSQLQNDAGYLSQETDPEYIEEKTNLVTKTNLLRDLNNSLTSTYNFQIDDIMLMQNPHGVGTFTLNDSLIINDHHVNFGANNISTPSADYTLTYGSNLSSLNNYAITIGNTNCASGIGSIAEGFQTTALGNYSHAAGSNTTASGNYAVAVGNGNNAIGNGSVAEGFYTSAMGNYSHAAGYKTIAIGEYSTANGCHTIALDNHQHVEGKWNKPLPGYAYIVGAGKEGVSSAIDGERKNIYTLDWDGNATFFGNVSAKDVIVDNKSLKDNVYTKTETNNQINAGLLTRIKYVVSETKPTAEEAEENTIYFVPKREIDISNNYYEYIKINGIVETIGVPEIDFSAITAKLYNKKIIDFTESIQYNDDAIIVTKNVNSYTLPELSTGKFFKVSFCGNASKITLTTSENSPIITDIDGEDKIYALDLPRKYSYVEFYGTSAGWLITNTNIF